MARTYLSDLRDAYPESDIWYQMLENDDGDETSEVTIGRGSMYVKFVIRPDVWAVFSPAKSENLIKAIALLNPQLSAVYEGDEDDSSGIV